jgi:hypothetical protein
MIANSISTFNRRTFLRGASGAMMALPLLEASAADPASPPKRLVAAGVFYGMMPDMFFPETVGRDYEMPRLLKPMEQHRDEFTVFSGLDHNLSGGHETTKYFLCGIPQNQAKGYQHANISLDQRAAMHVGAATRYPALALGCEVDDSNYMSWSRHGSQVRPVKGPSSLYDLLFRQQNATARKQHKRQMSERESILDLVRDQAKSFERGLGQADKDKLDQYYTSVRELELKVEQSRLWLNHDKPTSDYKLPRSTSDMTLAQKTPIFYDLMVLALQTDSTRCMTLSFSGLGKDHGGLPGVNRDYHTLSHHGKEKSAINKLAVIETFYMQQFADFVGKLKAVREPNGKTLLDNTMALFGSGMSNGNSHSNRDLPVVLAGGGFKHGEHKHYARDGRTSTSLCNLYLTMLQQFGLEIDSFNTSTGTLTGLEKA